VPLRNYSLTQCRENVMTSQWAYFTGAAKAWVHIDRVNFKFPFKLGPIVGLHIIHGVHYT